MPAVSVTRLVLFGETYSILDGVVTFWSHGRYGLFVLVFAFSVVLPVAKLAVGIWAWCRSGPRRPGLQRALRLFAAVSKWSMLDVFMVALLVLALEGSVITTADIHAGLVLFAAAVLTSSLALHRLARRAGS